MTTAADTTPCPSWCYNDDRNTDGSTLHRSWERKIGGVSLYLRSTTDASGAVREPASIVVTGDANLTGPQALKLAALIRDTERLMTGGEPADPTAVQVLRDMIEAAGCSGDGLPDTLTRSEVEQMAVELGHKLAER